VHLLAKIGETSYPVNELPIEIVSLDGTSVSFRIKQTILQSQVDSVFTSFNEPIEGTHAYNPVCYEERGKEAYSTTTEIYTAYCMIHTATPLAVVRVYVSDASLPVEDNGKVPACCHASGDAENNVVEFSFEVRCECPNNTETGDRTRNLLRGSNNQ
jgi:hypothetical protein